jgi:hypothetical protein
MGGGAWPLLVGGVICLVNSVNERDLNLLTSYANYERIEHINAMHQSQMMPTRV